MPADDAWAPLAGRFVDGHYGTLRGRVRTHVIAAHLHDHLPRPPAGLVDIGGGAGNQSIPLARAGYRVTIVDPSEAMLARARTRLAGEPGEVAGRVRLVQASAAGAREALGGARFAGVLCHGVIMYVEEPRPFVAALADLAEPGGIISLVAKNARVLAARPALAGDWAEALAAFDTDHQVNGLGVDTRGDTVEDLTVMLAGHGVQRIAWYGVRLFTDGWTRASGEDGGAGELACEVELQASRRDPYRLMSRLFHIVGRRAAGH
ncbi:MAG TPA: methyltransferase [Streptosporangiaceae bacterium]|jgi:S-adenosylmethionine-dependent methyltransferase|nr:methyltransferase [Streptosporangiaceae bacterium]